MYTLYIYDHCPYCVKAEMIFGLKDIPVALEYILNDDAATPTKMIGRKMVPILKKEDSSFMPESMDIVHYIDEAHAPAIVARPENNEKLQQWLTDSRDYAYKLAMPRWVQADLPEFRTEEAKAFFIERKEEMIGPFEENLKQSALLVRQANDHLRELESLIQSPEAVHGELTEDDFHLFARLHSLSIVKDLRYPEKVEAYRQTMAKKSKVSLHDAIAI